MDTKLIVALNFAQLKTMSKIKKSLNGKVSEWKGEPKKETTLLKWNFEHHKITHLRVLNCDSSCELLLGLLL